MRTRDFRRAQRERVITRRLRHIREWSTGWYRAAILPGQKVRTFTLDGEERWTEWSPRPERRQNDYWGQDVPGKWAKQDPYAHGRCGVCTEANLDIKRARAKLLDREAREEYVGR